MPRLHGPIYPLMAEALDLRPEDELLEVACGSGTFLARHAGHVGQVAGLDLSDLQIDLARGRLAERIASGTTEIVKGDAAELPWEEGRFSVVTCMGSMEAFPDPARVLAEMLRVLRPGGRAALAMGSRLSEGTETHQALGSVWYWSESDARRLVEEAGFIDVSVTYADISWRQPAGSGAQPAREDGGHAHRAGHQGGVDRAARARAVSAAATDGADERRPGMETANWYLEHKSGIMRRMRFVLRYYRKEFVKAYGKAEGEAIAKETLQGFEVLLPDLPYIGGDENRLTQALYMTAARLAMYRSLRARGASIEEAARLIYLGAASFFNSVPTRWLMRWQGRRMFGRKRLEQFRHAASISQRRRYPDDWVFEVVEGDGQDFAFGADYTECGIVKYLAREGAPELAPYLCWIDYPQFAAMHLRLVRTETIAKDGQKCDFRLSRGTPVEVEPEFLHA